jgi:hypothetical protein
MKPSPKEANTKGDEQNMRVPQAIERLLKPNDADNYISVI